MADNKRHESEKILKQLENSTVKDRKLSNEMKQSFLDYSMSVIKSRAIPDYRDGLKPVHRRIIYAAYQEKLRYDQKYKKSAAIVGSVMASYHPHGDAAIYDALVRMSQNFSLRYPLIKGQGNFGSIDGDAPAAMRYTEAKLSKLSDEFLVGIDESWVDMVDNYDQSKQEPVVLPTLVPNVLINGAEGIAVGLATKIPPHNLSEVIDASLALLDNPDLGPMDMMKYIKGPDFPTGGRILNFRGVEKYFAKEELHKSVGGFKIAGNYKIESQAGRGDLIIITEIPYGVKKSSIVKEIALRIYQDKKNYKYVPQLGDYIVEVRDESNKDGIRIVIECEKGSNTRVVLNNLFKYTRLQINYSVNLTVLVDNEPKKLNVLDLLNLYLTYQKDVLKKRLIYAVEQLTARIHILEGRLKIVDDILVAIKIITTSDNPDEELIAKYDLTKVQLEDILALPIGRLKKLSTDKMQQELKEKNELKSDKEDILSKEERQKEELKKQLETIKTEYGDERKTVINESHDGHYRVEDLNDFIPQAFVVTKEGYINAVNLEDIVWSGRKTSTSLYEGDTVEYIVTANGDDYILFFSEELEKEKKRTGRFKVFRKLAYELQVGGGSKQKRGKLIHQLIPGLKNNWSRPFIVHITKEDMVDPDLFLAFVTEKGKTKKVPISKFKNIFANGSYVNVFKKNSDDKLKFVFKTKESHVEEVKVFNGPAPKGLSKKEREIRIANRKQTLKAWNKDNSFDWMLIVSTHGKALKFPVAACRTSGKKSIGSVSIATRIHPTILSASSSYQGNWVLSLSVHGIGKVTKLKTFSSYSRGNKVGNSIYYTPSSSTTWRRVEFLTSVAGDDKNITEERLDGFMKSTFEKDNETMFKIMNKYRKRPDKEFSKKAVEKFKASLTHKDRGAIPMTRKYFEKLKSLAISEGMLKILTKNFKSSSVDIQVVKDYLDKLDQQTRSDLEAFGKHLTEKNIEDHKKKITKKDSVKDKDKKTYYEEAKSLLTKLIVSRTTNPGDLLICTLVSEGDEFLLVTNENKFHRFKFDDVNNSSKTSAGHIVVPLEMADKADFEQQITLSVTREDLVKGQKITLVAALVKKTFKENIVAITKIDKDLDLQRDDLIVNNNINTKKPKASSPESK